MKEILEAICSLYDYVFDYGRSDYHNLFKEVEKENTPHIYLDPVEIDDVLSDSNSVEAKRFTGSFFIAYSSNIDEKDYKTRYDNYIKPVLDESLELIENQLKCVYNALFVSWKRVEAINILDYNLDGVIVTYNVQIDIEDLTSFDQEFTVNISSSSGGVLKSSLGKEGTYQVKKGQQISVYALSDEGSQFTNITINGNETTINPFCLIVTKNLNIVGNFEAEVLQTFAKCFTAPPQYNATEKQWEWLNQEAGQSADNKIINNNQRLINAGMVIDNLPFTNEPDITFNMIYRSSTKSGYFLQRQGEYIVFTGNTGTNTPKLRVSLWLNNVVTNFVTDFTVQVGKPYQTRFKVDNTAKTVTISALRLEDDNYQEEIFNFTGEILNASISETYLTRDVYLCYLHSANINNERIITSIAKNGLTVTNRANNDIQDVELYDTNVQTAYDIFDNTGLFEPIQYTKGVSIYSDNSAPTDSNLYRFVPYLENGTPATDNEGGYSLVGHFPPGSGILKGISNTCEFNNSTDLATFAASQIFFNTETPYTYEQIRGWLTNGVVEKIEDANSVQSLEFKS